jgi:cytochrome c553
MRCWHRSTTMSFFRVAFFSLTAAFASAGEPAQPSHALVWDAMEKIHTAKPGEERATFEFTVTNSSDRVVAIGEIQPSCGCTVAELPATPWVLAPKARGSFKATMEFLGRDGTVSKTLTVSSTEGGQTLTVTVKIPEPDPAMRQRNQELAKSDRQAVFRNDCASCHVTPTVGKEGAALFAAACTICHTDEKHRASFVPDLWSVREKRDARYWAKWIGEGKEGTLMPAFAKQHGGPLSDEQIDSLVTFALRHLPTEPEKK